MKQWFYKLTRKVDEVWPVVGHFKEVLYCLDILGVHIFSEGFLATCLLY